MKWAIWFYRQAALHLIMMCNDEAKNQCLHDIDKKRTQSYIGNQDMLG